MSQPLIFITGATGFIGAHVVTQALAAGYKLRLSVRRETQIPTLRDLFAEHAASLDFIVISDFASPGAFAKALQDVTYVFHLASPMPGKGSDFETDYLNPAVQGTIALLEAAQIITTIKRIIIVSSLLALIPLDALITQNFTAKEGTNPTIPIPTPLTFPTDPASSAGLKYHASKLLAHRATLKWTASHRPHFRVITLHPSFVFGPNLLQTGAQGIDGTNAMLWASLTAQKPIIPMSAVDVRDVAAAHVRAVDVQLSTDAGAEAVEEFILCAGTEEGWTWGRVGEFVGAGFPGVGVMLEGPFEVPPNVDARKAEGVLGMRWRGMEDTIGAFLEQQLAFRSQL